jgi:hypothetical protein
MRIDMFNMPSIDGMKPEQAVKVLHSHCYDTGVVILQMNREIEDLKDQIEQLIARQR